MCPTLVLHAKNAGIATTEAAQVLLAYEHMDGELRRDLPRPQDNSTIPGMLEELRHQKDIWFAIYGSHQARPSAMPSSRYDSSRQDKGKQPQGQYGSNPFRPFNFQRPYDNVFGGKGFGSYDGAPRPFGSSNPYGRPFVPYGSNFQSNNNTQ